MGKLIYVLSLLRSALWKDSAAGMTAFSCHLYAAPGIYARLHTPNLLCWWLSTAEVCLLLSPYIGLVQCYIFMETARPIQKICFFYLTAFVFLNSIYTRTNSMLSVIQRIRGFLTWYALYKFTFYLLTYLSEIVAIKTILFSKSLF